MSDVEEKKKELDHVRGALSINGYPDWILSDKRGGEEEVVETGVETVSVSTEPSVQDIPVTTTEGGKKKRKKFPVILPYVKGMSEELRRVFGKFEVPAYFKPTNTLRQLLVRPKDPVVKERVVGPVYKISCEECEATYIGETERSLKARFGEHRRPSSVNSEVSRHIHTDQPGHGVDMERTKILAVEPRWFERGVKEAIYIRANKPSLNRDGGRYNLPPVWNNIVKRLVEGPGTVTKGARSSDL